MATEKNSLPTIDIKGKEYVLVKDRVLHFNEAYPNGAIQTQRVISDEQGMEVFKAVVIPDCSKPERYFTGYSQAKRGEGPVNKTAALENAESSAVGRALAMMGIGVIESIASADEMVKSGANKEEKKEVKKADNGTELPWFNKPELERLSGNKEYLEKFNTSEDLIKDIEKHYRISKEMKLNIANVWAE